MQKKEIIFFHSCGECPRVERDAQTDEMLNHEVCLFEVTYKRKVSSWLVLILLRQIFLVLTCTVHYSRHSLLFLYETNIV
jgi:hypothetical protein